MLDPLGRAETRGVTGGPEGTSADLSTRRRSVGGLVPAPSRRPGVSRTRLLRAAYEASRRPGVYSPQLWGRGVVGAASTTTRWVRLGTDDYFKQIFSISKNSLAFSHAWSASRGVPLDRAALLCRRRRQRGAGPPRPPRPAAQAPATPCHSSPSATPRRRDVSERERSPTPKQAEVTPSESKRGPRAQHGMRGLTRPHSSRPRRAGPRG